jgi:hypothetical protein
MPRIFEDGFESGDTTAFDGVDLSNATAEVVDTKAFKGKYSLKCVMPATGDNANARVVKNISKDEVYVRAYFWIERQMPPDNDDRYALIRIIEASGNYAATFQIYKTGGVPRWKITGKATTGFAAGKLGSAVPTEPQWICLEAHVRRGTDGLMELYVNGVKDIEYTGDASGIETLTQVQVGIAAKSGTTSAPPAPSSYDLEIYTDDMVIADEYIGLYTPPPPTLAETITEMMNSMISILMTVLVMRMMFSMLKSMKTK